MRQRRLPPPPDVLLTIARSGALSADGEVLLGRFRLQKNIADRGLCVKCQILQTEHFLDARYMDRLVMDSTLLVCIEAFRETFNAKMKDESNLTRMTGYISQTQASQI